MTSPRIVEQLRREGAPASKRQMHCRSNPFGSSSCSPGAAASATDFLVRLRRELNNLDHAMPQSWFIVVVSLCALACGETKTTDTDASSPCIAAGGQCVLSESICASPSALACPKGPIGMFCCLSVDGSCGQPTVTTFSACDAGPPSCNGTPAKPELIGIPADAALGPDEPDASFPMGCTITYPLCSDQGVYRCVCGSGWTCIP